MLNHAFDQCQTCAVCFQGDKRLAVADDSLFARFAINAARRGMLNAAPKSFPVTVYVLIAALHKVLRKSVNNFQSILI